MTIKIVPEAGVQKGDFGPASIQDQVSKGQIDVLLSRVNVDREPLVFHSRNVIVVVCTFRKHCLVSSIQAWMVLEMWHVDCITDGLNVDAKTS